MYVNCHFYENSSQKRLRAWTSQENLSQYEIKSLLLEFPYLVCSLHKTRTVQGNLYLIIQWGTCGEGTELNK